MRSLWRGNQSGKHAWEAWETSLDILACYNIFSIRSVSAAFWTTTTQAWSATCPSETNRYSAISISFPQKYSACSISLIKHATIPIRWTPLFSDPILGKSFPRSNLTYTQVSFGVWINDQVRIHHDWVETVTLFPQGNFRCCGKRYCAVYTWEHGYTHRFRRTHHLLQSRKRIHGPAPAPGTSSRHACRTKVQFELWWSGYRGGKSPRSLARGHLRLQGLWDKHPKHGSQFKAEVCEQTLPATVAGSRAILAPA